MALSSGSSQKKKKCHRHGMSFFTLLLLPLLVFGHDPCWTNQTGNGAALTDFPDRVGRLFYTLDLTSSCTTDDIRWAAQLVGKTEGLSFVYQLCQQLDGGPDHRHSKCGPEQPLTLPFTSGTAQKISNDTVYPRPFVNITLVKRPSDGRQITMGFFSSINSPKTFRRFNNLPSLPAGDEVLETTSVSKKEKRAGTSSSNLFIFGIEGLYGGSLYVVFNEKNPAPENFRFCWNAFNRHMEPVHYRFCSYDLNFPPNLECTDWVKSSDPAAVLEPKNVPIIPNVFGLMLDVKPVDDKAIFGLTAIGGPKSSVIC